MTQWIPIGLRWDSGSSDPDADVTDEEDIFSAGEEMTSLVDAREDEPLDKEKPRVTAALLLSAFGISTGSFQYGYNVSVLNEPFQVLQAFINETSYHNTGQYLTSATIRFYWSAIVSVFALGGAIGACALGWWSVTFGRKRGCLANTLLGFAATIMMVLSPTFHSFLSLFVGRFIMGIHAGLYTGLCPLYLNEISTPLTRGPLGVIHQTGTVAGLLVAQILGFPILLGSEHLWVLLLGFAAVPLVIQITVLSFCPESPRFIAKVQKDVSATRDALRQLRGTYLVEEELFKLTDDKESSLKEKSSWELVRMSDHRIKLILAIMIMMCPHLAGSIAVVFYSSLIFEDVGESPTQAMYATSGIGATLVVFAVLSIWLVNRAGRRLLLLLGLMIMSVSSAVIVVLNEVQQPEAVVAAVLVFILGFAIGPGPIPFLVVPELFPSDVRRSALAISIPFNWLANFSVGLAFPSLMASLKHLTFSVFAAGSMGVFVFLYFLLPETRPGPLEDLSFSYQGEDFSQAARASLSIDLHSSHSDGSKEPTVIERLRQGLSRSAILGDADFRQERRHLHRQDSKGRKSKTHRKYTFYEPSYNDDLATGKLQRALSDGAYSQVHHHHLSRSSHETSRKFSHLSENSRKSKGNGVAASDKTPVLSNAMRALYSPTDLEYGSGNSGLTSLMNSHNSSDWTESGATGDERLYSQKHHLSFNSKHFGEGAREVKDSGHDQSQASMGQRKLPGNERVERSRERRSTSLTVHETWTDSCDADVEAD